MIKYIAVFRYLLFVLLVGWMVHVVSANTYVVDTYFTVPETVYVTNEQLEIKGFVYIANYTNAGVLVNASYALSGAKFNLTVTHSTNGSVYKTINFTTDSDGAFYTKSDFYPNAIQLLAPSSFGKYKMKTNYTDPNGKSWYSEVEISVINKSVSEFDISADKVQYNASDTVFVELEAVNFVGDRSLYTANISINGSLRNSSKNVLETFGCITGENGKCKINVTAPTTSGEYILEANNYSAFSSFIVVPFSFSVYMKDELGKSLKNVYAQTEKARVEVRVSNASTNDVYNFTGKIIDSSGNVIKLINSTILNNNNSFTNTFQFNVDSVTFGFGTYSISVDVKKNNGGLVSSSTSFEVKDWIFTLNKRESNSGFAYGNSAFTNKTLRFDVFPTLRLNGSLITDINGSAFTIQLRDKLNNVVSTANISWNGSCGSEGCYQFPITTPTTTGKYRTSVTLKHGGVTETEIKTVIVISGVLDGVSTDENGNLKELFGTNEFAYISLSAYNSTTLQFNVSDAEVLSVTYMNGTEVPYSKVENFSLVNLSNSVNEWAWNISRQRIKLDVPAIGGLYTIGISANNKSLGTESKFIVNPYEACISSKDSAGEITAGSNSYYVWQFKTTDTVYFEIKLTQAENPLGRATAANATSGNSSLYGSGVACSIDTSTQTVVENATITVVEVKNSESGGLQNVNNTGTSCQSTDSSGSYLCTLKPVDRWEGGPIIVKFKVKGQDGTLDTAYGRFEARAFYMYGWSNVWQNSPFNNITLNVRLYEAGRGWWGSSGGLSGTISLSKIEYMGRAGEYVWPPVNSGYNVTNVTASTVTSGSGTLSVPVKYLPSGKWKTGTYRAVIKGTTSSGDIDYGYAWFGVKLWNVYGTPVSCTIEGCSYKSNFNSKDNVTLYIKIGPPGNYNYNDAGGSAIEGQVTVSVKKINDCSRYPCRELNATKYQGSKVVVSTSSRGYWKANLTGDSDYLMHINRTDGSWGTGSYNVILDVNGSDSANAWFNTLPFYVDIKPTNATGSVYISYMKGNSNMYFNVSTVRSKKTSFTYGGSSIQYNGTDYVNVTLVDAVLRRWDPASSMSVEYNFPEDINVTPNALNGTILMNVSYLNGTWPTGYYYGDLELKNVDNETSKGYLRYSVSPFRISFTSTLREVDSEQGVTTTVRVYEPSYRTSTFLHGNYTITSVFEDIWTGSSNTRITYTNFTIGSFNATANITINPNSADWGNGNWGGYHYLRVEVKDTNLNSTQLGYLYFKSVPFNITWDSVQGGTNKLTSENFVVQANVRKFSTNAITTANLTRMYQYRYDGNNNGEQNYVFSVGSCFSNVTSKCVVNGSQNITVYAPTDGWKVGYNYIYAEWTKESDSSSRVNDYRGVYVEGRNPYNGYYQSSDSSGIYKYNFANSENLTIKLFVRDSDYVNADVNITNVQFSAPGEGCFDEWCRTYSDATWSLRLGGGGNQTSGGNVILSLKAPATNWVEKTHYIRASVSGPNGTATIKGGTVEVKNLAVPNITIVSPQLRSNITSPLLNISLTTNTNAQCYVYVDNYDHFNNFYCFNWESVGGNATAVPKGHACNVTKYGYNGTIRYGVNFYTSYYAFSNSTSYIFTNKGLTTGGTNHNITLDITGWPTQHYGMQAYCVDSNFNSKANYTVFYMNFSGDNIKPTVTINLPKGINYSSSSHNFNVSLNENGSVMYSLDNGVTNVSMFGNQGSFGTLFNHTNTSLGDGLYNFTVYANDTAGNNRNGQFVTFRIDTIKPLISYGAKTPSDGANYSAGGTLYINISYTESNLANITFHIRNDTAIVNETTHSQSLVEISGFTFKNFTTLTLTNYTYNVSIVDKAGNINWTANRKVNLTSSDSTAPNITSSLPRPSNYSTSNLNFNITLSENGSARYSLDGGINNISMVSSDEKSQFGRLFNHTNSSLGDGLYTFTVYANDTAGNKNHTYSISFRVDTVFPLISYGVKTPADGANYSANGTLFINVTFTEANIGNLTFNIRNNTAIVNSSLFFIYNIPSPRVGKFFNITSLPLTNYSYNVSIMDSAGNINWTANRIVNITG